MNAQKYQSMLLGARISEDNNIVLHTDGVNIEQLESVKLFGVLLDSELNFSPGVGGGGDFSDHISSVITSLFLLQCYLVLLQSIRQTQMSQPHMASC